MFTCDSLKLVSPACWLPSHFALSCVTVAGWAGDFFTATMKQRDTTGHYTQIQSLQDRFWEKVKKLDGADPCWLWDAYKDGAGYGKLQINKRSFGAHRQFAAKIY